MKLRAKSHILFNGIDYIPGDELPECDFSETWLASGAAYVDEEKPQQEAVIARPAAATSGLIGFSNGTADIVGRIPMTEQRKRVPANQRRTKRKKAYE